MSIEWKKDNSYSQECPLCHSKLKVNPISGAYQCHNCFSTFDLDRKTGRLERRYAYTIDSFQLRGHSFSYDFNPDYDKKPNAIQLEVIPKPTFEESKKGNTGNKLLNMVQNLFPRWDKIKNRVSAALIAGTLCVTGISALDNQNANTTTNSNASVGAGVTEFMEGFEEFKATFSSLEDRKALLTYAFINYDYLSDDLKEQISNLNPNNKQTIENVPGVQKALRFNK